MTLTDQLATYQSTNRLGIDLLASRLGSDKISLTRLLNGSAPETSAQAIAELRLIAAATVLLAIPVTVPRKRLRAGTGARITRLAAVVVDERATRNRLVRRYKQILHDRGLTNADIASLMGVSVATISEWHVSARQPPTNAEMDALSNIVDVTATISLGKRIKGRAAHPKLERIRDLLADYELSILESTIGVARDADACNINAPLEPPVVYETKESPMGIINPFPLPTEYSTADDLVVIRRVADAIERMQVSV